jgi:hypothetical protein
VVKIGYLLDIMSEYLQYGRISVIEGDQEKDLLGQNTLYADLRFGYLWWLTLRNFFINLSELSFCHFIAKQGFIFPGIGFNRVKHQVNLLIKTDYSVSLVLDEPA